MNLPKRLLYLPLLLATLLFFLAGEWVFGLVFGLISSLFAIDFYRRSESGQAEIDDVRQDAPLAEEYRLLGLEPGASEALVRKTYRALAAQFHPDTGAPLSDEQRQASQEAFLRIRAAYERIIDKSG